MNDHILWTSTCITYFVTHRRLGLWLGLARLLVWFHESVRFLGFWSTFRYSLIRNSAVLVCSKEVYTAAGEHCLLRDPVPGEAVESLIHIPPLNPLMSSVYPNLHFAVSVHNANVLPLSFDFKTRGIMIVLS